MKARGSFLGKPASDGGVEQVLAVLEWTRPTGRG